MKLVSSTRTRTQCRRQRFEKPKWCDDLGRSFHFDFPKYYQFSDSNEDGFIFTNQDAIPTVGSFNTKVWRPPGPLSSTIVSRTSSVPCFEWCRCNLHVPWRKMDVRELRYQKMRRCSGQYSSTRVSQTSSVPCFKWSLCKLHREHEAIPKVGSEIPRFADHLSCAVHLVFRNILCSTLYVAGLMCT
jgi:hypothetical protein